jgi:hypothetical protein
MISNLTDGLKTRYGEITLKHGPMINYFDISLDFTYAGEARLTMAGYVDEILTTSGVTEQPALQQRTLYSTKTCLSWSPKVCVCGSTESLYSCCTWPREYVGSAYQQCHTWPDMFNAVQYETLRSCIDWCVTSEVPGI